MISVDDIVCIIKEILIMQKKILGLDVIMMKKKIKKRRNKIWQNNKKC